MYNSTLVTILYTDPCSLLTGCVAESQLKHKLLNGKFDLVHLTVSCGQETVVFSSGVSKQGFPSVFKKQMLSSWQKPGTYKVDPLFSQAHSS